MSFIEIYPNLNAISHSFPALLLDAYGVFWGGNQVGLFPGAKETMNHFISEGRVVGILSNTTQLAVKEIQKLEMHGLKQGEHFHFLLTSGEIGRTLFLKGDLPFPTPHHKFWLFGEEHPLYSSHQHIFQGTLFQKATDLTEADFIYLSIPHINGEDQVDPQIFCEQLLPLVESHLPMVCPNPDRFAHEGFPPKAVVRQGSIAAIYEELGGEVFYIGKPHAKAYETAIEKFSHYHITNPSDVIMIGDTPETDIRGAKKFGMGTALTTQSGMMKDRIDHLGLELAIKQLTLEDTPHFFIEKL